MTEPTAEAYKLIGILLGMGSLTPRQAQRLQRAVEQGEAVEDAIARLPLVEPLDALRARRLITPATEEPPLPEQPVEPKEPTAPPAAAALKRDEDGIPFFELEEAPPPPKGFTPPEQRLRPVDSKRKRGTRPDSQTVAAPPAPAMQAEELTDSEIGIAERADDIDESTLPRIDLMEDDGIPLVRDIHEMLAAAPRNNLGALQFAWCEDSGAIAEYARSGKRIAAREHEGVETEKMVAHLMIVARLSPRKKSPQEAWIETRRRNVRFLVHLRRESVGRGNEKKTDAKAVGIDRLTLSILEQFT